MPVTDAPKTDLRKTFEDCLTRVVRFFRGQKFSLMLNQQ